MTTQATQATEMTQRYYAYYDHTAKQPTHIIGWIDALGYGAELPPKEDLIALTQDVWDARDIQNSGVSNGELIYLPHQNNPAPITAVSLKDQASGALNQASSVLYQNYGMLNEPTPPEWVDYVKKLKAIANGTDTTSTELPNEPK